MGHRINMNLICIVKCFCDTIKEKDKRWAKTIKLFIIWFCCPLSATCWQGGQVLVKWPVSYLLEQLLPDAFEVLKMLIETPEFCLHPWYSLSFILFFPFIDNQNLIFHMVQHFVPLTFYNISWAINLMYFMHSTAFQSQSSPSGHFSLQLRAILPDACGFLSLWVTQASQMQHRTRPCRFLLDSSSFCFSSVNDITFYHTLGRNSEILLFYR